MFSFDLKSDYHHVEMYEPHRHYLGFQWQYEGRAKCFEFTVLSLAWLLIVVYLLNYCGHWLGTRGHKNCE